MLPVQRFEETCRTVLEEHGPQALQYGATEGYELGGGHLGGGSRVTALSSPEWATTHPAANYQPSNRDAVL
jgi:hypothetical protein